MQPIRLFSVVEQTAEHLRKGLHEGRWRGNLPGVVQLATECDVAIRNMRAALQQLEAECLLTPAVARAAAAASLPPVGSWHPCARCGWAF